MTTQIGPNEVFQIKNQSSTAPTTTWRTLKYVPKLQKYFVEQKSCPGAEACTWQCLTSDQAHYVYLICGV